MGRDRNGMSVIRLELKAQVRHVPAPDSETGKANIEKVHEREGEEGRGRKTMTEPNLSIQGAPPQPTLTMPQHALIKWPGTPSRYPVPHSIAPHLASPCYPSISSLNNTLFLYKQMNNIVHPPFLLSSIPTSSNHLSTPPSQQLAPSASR